MPFGAPRSRRAPRRDRGRNAAVAALVLLLVAVAALVVVLEVRDRTGTATPSAGSGEQTSASPSATRRKPTAAAMETFVRDYLSTAPSDPQRGFERLTSGYQQDSNGLTGYESFWGTVASATPTRVEADPGTLTVAYDVAYRYDNGSSSTDAVTLRLVLRDGRYLIAGEAP